ncbi:indolepyruvate ferredoxin oxidoreductase family protein [Actibacterium sp. XHP0104]|uniref:indolepyruvate ferredoxin oxidoreductase family protein n=1 Tax=Actibacterium sp. XHP0104 TaxID=2984335 RepID=UPI0021E8ED5A|nr:indolepyruvate ferredoxin oxidoreductase family protein [Actibacterium sp. XHP0104]MCV2880853.1 indolepyruvate ferredoxin oxidoreductase family protein [Actibacterium sp. XHP0104]
MSRQDVTLHDKYDLDKDRVLLNGTQALVRLMLMQKARDRAAGLNTAGYVSGYRGSPLGAVDIQMTKARSDLEANDIIFQPGMNEDLAATAIWGTQQAELRGEGKFDGVFGLWYGKGPGVDRTGDVMRHANMAGTSQYGGVLMAMGDDHTGESSTTCHQSDWALVDVYMPVLSPAGVQEILDYGLYGFALSRYAGVWAGLKVMKDTIEVTSVVNARVPDTPFVIPDLKLPADGLNIRLGDHWIPQEARLHDYKRFAAEAFARANKIDKRVWGRSGAKIGLVAAGKNWLDLTHALALMGIDAAEAERLGLTTYKVGQTWPLDMTSFHDWAEGLDLIIVVEEKRKLIEVQVKEAIFDDRQGRRVYGWKDGEGNDLFPTRFALNPVMIARKLGDILIQEGRGTEAVKAAMQRLEAAEKAENAEEVAARIPYFCSGCPHNTSTKLPQGSRAYAGIGCHIMALWMDRETSGYTHMGGEGANWIGEGVFSNTDHVFQNLGDGTYNHSGLMAIRAAHAAGTNITYKILFNDAVAMTGGQENEGDLSADRIARELLAMGLKDVFVVYDPKEEPERKMFPQGLSWHERDQLMSVQEKCKKIKGVSAIIYIQTCAAEKRRRRKRGTFPDIDKRVFINTDVCEGCGDCGVQSNCVSIIPVETELGRKRAIDQSSCNKDFSCVNGFCPSFVTLKGAEIRKEASAEIDLPHLPDPVLPAIDGTWNIVATGVGGTGVVTVGAILAMAAHLDGKGVGMMEMAGLAQKGGAVLIHCRIANDPADISAIRVATGEADAVIGGDLVVSAGAKSLGLMTTGRTGAVVNSHEIITGAFTRDPEFRLPTGRMHLALEARLKDGLSLFDASELSRVLMGDTIYSNMMVLGAAWQRGLVPLGHDALIRAIELNGAAAERNKRAFEIGRWAIAHPTEAARLIDGPGQEAPLSLDERISIRADHLTAYQGRGLARKYLRLVERAEDEELREAIAKGYHKLLAYKDEYEVARLHLETHAKAQEEFGGDFEMTFHLAPPIWSKTGADGRPQKREFGPWVLRLFRGLARLKRLRGTPLDVFGYSAERKMERGLIKQYERDIERVLLAPAGAREAALALAELPLSIRGFGPVKEANADKAAKRREELLAVIAAGGPEIRKAAE